MQGSDKRCSGRFQVIRYLKYRADKVGGGWVVKFDEKNKDFGKLSEVIVAVEFLKFRLSSGTCIEWECGFFLTRMPKKLVGNPTRESGYG